MVKWSEHKADCLPRCMELYLHGVGPYAVEDLQDRSEFTNELIELPRFLPLPP
jgi:hypothetical protein